MTDDYDGPPCSDDDAGYAHSDEGPPKPDASITYVTVDPPITSRAQLLSWERDLLLALTTGARGIEGDGITVTIERFERAGLVTLAYPKGMLYAEITDEGRKAAQQGWYEV